MAHKVNNFVDIVSRAFTMYTATCFKSLQMKKKRHSVIIHLRMRMKYTLLHRIHYLETPVHHMLILRDISVMVPMLKTFMAHGQTSLLTNLLFGWINGGFLMLPVDSYVEPWRRRIKKQERQAERNIRKLLE